MFGFIIKHLPNLFAHDNALVEFVNGIIKLIIIKLLFTIDTCNL